MPKKSQNGLPELFTSENMDKDKIYYLQKLGEVRRIAPALYTSNMKDGEDLIVRNNLWEVVGLLYPGAVISERTAVKMEISEDGSLFVISDKKRPTTIGGIKIKPKKGAAPQKSDLPFMNGLYMASPARIVLENAAPSRATKGVARTLSRIELEEYLDKIIKNNGEAAINKLRGEMRVLAPKTGLAAEFDAVNKLISALLRTHEGKLESKAGIARGKGFPFDDRRVELFAKLYTELEHAAPIIREGKSTKNLVFFEAYFSNFIEGTEFEVEEAEEIIFKGVVPQKRPEDAHDIKGTFDIVSNETEMRKTPKTFDDFMDLLKSRHKILLGGRQGKEPGKFKERANRAGSTSFVRPDLVVGTFMQGFEIYKKLTTPFSKAAFMMFLVAEVHPFNDGNGRVGRVMMNAELVSADEHRIIIPTIYRNNYIAALRAASQNGITNPTVRVLDFAQKYAKAINWDSFDEALDMLKKTHAFLDPNEAEDKNIRLIMPGATIG